MIFFQPDDSLCNNLGLTNDIFDVHENVAGNSNFLESGHPNWNCKRLNRD